MPSSENRVILACAGSGKTTRLVNEALSGLNGRIAILTYTNKNLNEIISRFGRLSSGVPKHVDVMSWFSFLLRHCARPYQRSKYSERRIESIAWNNARSARGIAEADTRRHYFSGGDRIYQDKISELIVKCNQISENRVTARLEQIYTDVFVDEFQDLAGWDLDVIELLLRSSTRLTLVGDPRQHILDTNPSPKNKQYLGPKVINLISRWEKGGLCRTEPMSGSHRCNQAICDFSNGLWPTMGDMRPLACHVTGHDGVFLVSKNYVRAYIESFHPQVLHNSKSSESYGCNALNFGIAKGLEFDRVLIVPTGPISSYLKTGDLKYVEKEKPRHRLYVAITRARHSVAFVHDGPSQIVADRWHASRC